MGEIPAGRLVFFHNHGDPGPGVYLPSGWKQNRVQLQPGGFTVEDPQLIAQLEPLPPEGFYRVTEAFFCCDKQCRRFEFETLVQLGYNAEGQGILFLPELVDSMFAVPQTGVRIDSSRFDKLKQLTVKVVSRSADAMH
jgi:hypothetical protein